MNQVHIPAVFVSSTSYDLDQIRADLKQFIEGIGYDAVLSEYPSFPIDPDIRTVENCLRAVDRRADIFVLVVGGRYGSQTGDGKSVTNLEYLRAKFKEIPIYVFVTKAIFHILPIWRNNPNADFKSVADSHKLFQFVDQLMNIDKVWVYPFERAEDITTILKTQLAYLFGECLELRQKIHQSHLPETVAQLRGEALRLVLEKPDAWEGRLLNQILSDEIASLRNRRRDLNYKITSGQKITIPNSMEFLRWVQNKLSEIMQLLSDSGYLINTVFREAMSQPGNTEYIVHVAKCSAELYRHVIEWTEDFNRIPANDCYNSMLTEFLAAGIYLLSDIEKFSTGLQDDIKTALSAPDEDHHIDAHLSLSLPDLTGLTEAVHKLAQKHGIT
jgi:hypothetical protein